MQPYLNESQARHVANWLYVVDAYLPLGHHINRHLQFALFRYSEGKEPKEVAAEITRAIEND